MTPTNEQIPLFKCETSRNRLDSKGYGFDSCEDLSSLKPINDKLNSLEDKISKLELA